MDNKYKRGFASFSKKFLREIASLGGKEAHRKGVAHKWTSETAGLAGRKGGKARALAMKNKQPV